MQQTDSDSKPWYRHFWVWFILAILGASVFHGLSLVYYAVKYGDSVVVDNYYDVGKGINQSLEREILANKFGVKAELRLNDNTGVAELILSGSSRPRHLVLNLISPTQAEKDRKVVLQAEMDGIYRGNLEDNSQGRRIVELLGSEKKQEWRLVEEVTLVSGEAVLLGQQ